MENKLIKIAFLGLLTTAIVGLNPWTMRASNADEIDEELQSTISSDPEYRGKKEAPPPAVEKAPEPAPEAPAPTNHVEEKEWKTMKSETDRSSVKKKSHETIKIDSDKNRIMTPKISFLSNSDQPTPGSKSTLKQLANFLNKYPDLSLRIEGHTDSIGYDQPNLELSQRRANSVMVMLTEMGVNPNRLVAVGMGDKHPIASSVTQEGQEKNRRVEFHIVGTESAEQEEPAAEASAPEAEAPPPPPPAPASAPAAAPPPPPPPPAAAPAPEPQAAPQPTLPPPTSAAPQPTAPLAAPPPPAPPPASTMMPPPSPPPPAPANPNTP